MLSECPADTPDDEVCDEQAVSLNFVYSAGSSMMAVGGGDSCDGCCKIHIASLTF